MKIREILAACMVVFSIILLLVSQAAAQTGSASEKGYTDRGVVELGGSIAFTSYTSVSGGQTSSTTYTNFSLSPSVGYFIADGLEIGIDPFSLTISSYTGASSSQTQLNILGSVAYVAKTQGAVFPFIQGMAGFSSYSSSGPSNSGFTWGVQGGVKVALVQHVLLLAGVQYLQVTENPSGATSRYGYNQLLVGVGFSVWL